MRRILIWLMLLCLPLAARAEYFYITQFDVDLNLQKDGDMLVREDIQVVFTAQRHGIFRTLPVEMPTPSGRRRLVLVDDIRVSDTTGNKSGMKVDKEGANLKIRIGDPDAYAPVGQPVTYTIQYRVAGMLNRFEEDAGWGRNVELYWNALGTEWPVEIRSSRVTLRWPEGAKPDQVRAIVFWGSYGSRTQVKQVGSGNLTEPSTKMRVDLMANGMRINNPSLLPPYQGLSFAVSMPTELIAPPSRWQEFRLKYSHLMWIMVPAGVGVAFLVIWFIWGRDPIHARREAMASVPDDMTGALAGALADGKFDRDDLSAVFISLAKKGKLVMHHDGHNDYMRLTGDTSTHNLDELEAYVLSLLIPNGPTIFKVDLMECVAPHMWQIKAKAFGELVKRGYYRSNPQSVTLAWGILGFILLVVVSLGVWSVTPYYIREITFLGFLVGLAALWWFARAMPRLTRRGSKAYTHVQSFAEYLDNAFPHRAKLGDRVMDQTLYEDYLDHAVAFRRSGRWSRAFHQAGVVRPAWFVGAGPVSDIETLGSDIGSFASEMGRAASTPPKSSGGGGGSSGFSGGGGVSGGGFGGGGGGSW